MRPQLDLCYTLRDILYLFIGAMIGGGLVLNGSVFQGRSGRAGGLGPLWVARPGGSTSRLLDQASLFVLEKRLRAGGITPVSPGRSDFWRNHPDLTGPWLQDASAALTQTILSSLLLIDFEVVIIDGSIPPQIRSIIVDQTRAEFVLQDLQGLVLPEFRAGQLGPLARAIGAAATSLNAQYGIDRSALHAAI
ncbi:ROK family protein [Palleronia caenipelagi]|uniref:ROK family protein n=1 Tax=Palleronia caenipelagi TaxID=2489174 RepID=A0A547PUF6_9RHOB|nr:ROK family protein [Palleronia caenipelagi]TRD17780.1 ROK family protein [Palleronia caenipelagi]